MHIPGFGCRKTMDCYANPELIYRGQKTKTSSYNFGRSYLPDGIGAWAARLFGAKGRKGYGIDLTLKS